LARCRIGDIACASWALSKIGPGRKPAPRGQKRGNPNYKHLRPGKRDIANISSKHQDAQASVVCRRKGKIVRPKEEIWRDDRTWLGCEAGERKSAKTRRITRNTPHRPEEREGVKGPYWEKKGKADEGEDRREQEKIQGQRLNHKGNLNTQKKNKKG